MHILIFSHNSEGNVYCYADYLYGGKCNADLVVKKKEYNCSFYYSDCKEIRPATEEEKQLLLSKLHEQGKDWDAENKQIVDYVAPYLPQDGDFVKMKITEEDKDYFLMIFHKAGPRDRDYYYACMYVDCERQADNEVFINSSCRCNIFIPATEEEKQLLLSKLHEIGKDWSAEKKEIVDWKWEPQELDPYWYPSYYAMQGIFYPQSTAYQDDELDDAVKARGQMCRTKEECQTMCDKLNAALKNI